MNLRTLLIIAGLGLPVATFAILSQYSPESPPQTPNPAQKVAAPADEQPKAQEKIADTASAEEPVNPDAGQIPKGVRPGPLSAPPVVLPPLGNNGTASEGAQPQPDANANANPQAQAPANPAAAVQPVQPPAGGMTLQQAIEKTKTRLGELEKMNPQQWPQERMRHRNAPATLAQAKEFNRTRLAALATMTEEQFQKQQAEIAQRNSEQWNQMTPQQQMQMFKAANQKPALPKLAPAGANAGQQ